MRVNAGMILKALLALAFVAASVWLLLMGLLFVALGSSRPQWAALVWGFVWLEINRFVWRQVRGDLFGVARTAKKRGMFRKIWLGCGAVLLAVAVFVHWQDARWYEHQYFSEDRFDAEFYQKYAPPSPALARLPQAASLAFTDDFPRMDGAKALYPVYAAIASALYGEAAVPDKPCRDWYQEPPIVGCKNTPGAFSALLAGDIDIAFLARPSAAQMAEAEKQGVKLRLTPIGREAFVFFVHRSNPVDSLSSQNLRDIYSGRLRTWRTLSGKWRLVRAFQRPEGSGSQSAMQHFMGEEKLMQPQKYNVVGGMGGIVERVAEYSHGSGAIGYSFRYFVETLHPDERVKIIAVDGVPPTRENIRSGRYALAYPFYAVTVAGRESEHTQQLLHWLQGDEAAEIIERSGYVRWGDAGGG